MVARGQTYKSVAALLTDKFGENITAQSLNNKLCLLYTSLDSMEKYKEAYAYYQKYSSSNAPEDEYKQYAKARLEELKQYAK